MGLKSKKDVVKSLKTFHKNFNNYICISIQKKQIPWVIFVAQQNFVHKILFAYKSHKVINSFLVQVSVHLRRILAQEFLSQLQANRKLLLALLLDTRQISCNFSHFHNKTTKDATKTRALQTNNPLYQETPEDLDPSNSVTFNNLKIVLVSLI